MMTNAQYNDALDQLKFHQIEGLQIIVATLMDKVGISLEEIKKEDKTLAHHFEQIEALSKQLDKEG